MLVKGESEIQISFQTKQSFGIPNIFLNKKLKCKTVNCLHFSRNALLLNQKEYVNK